MAVEAIPHKGGAGRAQIVCDDCNRSEVVPCAYVGNGNAASDSRKPNESQARAKALQLGWAYVKGKLRCLSCEAKRKSPPKEPEMQNVTKLKSPAPKPSKRERIQIISLLAEVYDLDAGMYTGGDTDETVASVLGVMPGFVAIVREAEFGPAGGNEDMKALKAQIETFTIEATEKLKASTDANERLIKFMEQAKEHKVRLDKIEKAVGARVLKRA